MEKHSPHLVAPAEFIGSITGEKQVQRTLLEQEGVQVTLRENAPGGYEVAGIQSHGVAVQCSSSGRHAATMEGRSYRGHASRGMSWLKPAGTALTWSWKDPVEIINIWIAPQTWTGMLGSAGGPGSAHVGFPGRFIAEDPLVHQIAFAFRASAESGGPYGRLLTDGLVAALIGHIAHGQASRAPPAALVRGGLAAWRLRRILEYIQANLADDMPLAHLSGLAGLSPRHFCTAFRQSTGLPPHRYLAQRRIERARDLLADRSLSMAAVAMALGFSSSQHFATMFRRNTGLTPGSYRSGLGLEGRFPTPPPRGENG